MSPVTVLGPIAAQTNNTLATLNLSSLIFSTTALTKTTLPHTSSSTKTTPHQSGTKNVTSMRTRSSKHTNADSTVTYQLTLLHTNHTEPHSQHNTFTYHSVHNPVHTRQHNRTTITPNIPPLTTPSTPILHYAPAITLNHTTNPSHHHK